ncbi:hypothetical protein SUGI_0491160 [Cryptomeria japonica]|nr:hypothetical protein SUGI_0491160 [Cryptomeria japonica]
MSSAVATALRPSATVAALRPLAGAAVQPPIRSPASSAADRADCGLGHVVLGLLAKPSSAAHLDFPRLGTDLKRFN